MKTILLVEDDENLRQGIAFVFARDDDHAVLCADTLRAAQNFLAQNAVDLIVLDLGLPDGDGIGFCKQIRAKSSVPIIMLTACDLETDEVRGLLSGADDYITKPFSLSVLRARVEALLRRAETGGGNRIQSGAFCLDADKCTLYKNEVEIPVSATEFRLLRYFMRNAGQVLTKEQILALWDKQGAFVDENTLPVNINRLRAKIENDPKNPAVIKTIHGLGYVWVKE